LQVAACDVRARVRVAQWLSFRNGQGRWRGRLNEFVKCQKTSFAGTGESQERKDESGVDFRNYWWQKIDVSQPGEQSTDFD
jgi:hypothetical protein